MRALLLAAALLLTPAAAPARALAAPAAPAPCPDADLTPTRATLARAGAATLCLMNRERAAHGAEALRADAALARSATRHARDMVRRGFFAHVAPGGTTPTDRIRATGFLASARAFALAENLAWGTGVLATPARTVAAWMASPGHRANLLDPRFRDAGVGVMTGAPGTTASPAATYTAHFATRR